MPTSLKKEKCLWSVWVYNAIFIFYYICITEVSSFVNSILQMRKLRSGDLPEAPKQVRGCTTL